MKLELTWGKPTPATARNMGRQMQSARVTPRDAEYLRQGNLAKVNAIRDRLTRIYDSATTTSISADFPGTFGNANAEILGSWYLSAARARKLEQDFPIATGIIRNDANNVVGEDAFPLEMKVGKWNADGTKFTLETEINRTVEDAWEDAGLPENCTVRCNMSRMELYRISEMSAFREGGILLRIYRDFPHNKYGFALKALEIDRLQTSYMGSAPNGNQIRLSIEYDKWDRPVAYWILTRHPGDVFTYNGSVPNVWRERVPADEIIYFPNIRNRAEQDVGFSEMASVMQHLHRDNQFDIAHATAAIWNAANPWFLVRDRETASDFSGDEQSREGEVFSNMEPGGGLIIPDGYKIDGPKTKFPNEAAGNFKKGNMASIGMGVGQALHAVSNEYDGLSFSAARSAETPQRDNYKIRQAHMRVMLVRVHFNAWLEAAILSGELDVPISRLEELRKAATFHGLNWDYINPLQDMQADIMAIEANLKSRTQVLAERRGRQNFEENIIQLSAENAFGKAHDIDLTPDIAKPTIPKGEPGAVVEPALEDAQPPSKTGATPGKSAGRKNGNVVYSEYNGNGKHRHIFDDWGNLVD